jgi:glycosyltransferase involved in cell wall biosynthesis
MTRLPLSVTVIACNEAARIGACLASVAWADEIVVVDGESRDDTVAIAKTYTDKVIQRRWPGYADQKNFAVSQASHDWILNLDADERVTEALAREIQETLAARPSHVGFYLARRNFFLGRAIRYAGWFPDYTLRLFDRRAGRFEARAVHEAVRVAGSTGRLQHPLLHDTYRTLAEFHTRTGRYAELAALQMKTERRSFHWVDLVARPAWTFFRMYLLRQGFREGLHGLLLCGLYAYYTFLKYGRLWEMEHEK